LEISTDTTIDTGSTAETEFTRTLVEFVPRLRLKELKIWTPQVFKPIFTSALKAEL